MKPLCNLAIGLGLLAAVCGQRDVAANQPAAVAREPLACLDRFIGEWEVEGKWSDGNPLKARTVYQWGLGKKILVTKTFVRDGEKEYQRYEGIFAWHPKKKCLFQTSYAYNGDITEVLIEQADNDTFHIGYKPFRDGEPAKVRQILKITGKDSFVWTVSLQAGDEWKQLIEATWHRKAK